MKKEFIEPPLIPYVLLKYMDFHSLILKGFMSPKDYENYVLSCEEMKWKEIKRNKMLHSTAVTWLEVNDE